MKTLVLISALAFLCSSVETFFFVPPNKLPSFRGKREAGNEPAVLPEGRGPIILILPPVAQGEGEGVQEENRSPV
ncbi:hypothetical protein HHUSO_G29938 [Huso huso]|uniref:Uncharacterized protein n=1 Tax=Huso huso TaxID=61971 RepID=A0ABR0YEF2_HUSHU